MILRLAISVPVIAAAMCCGSVAHADVLEISADGEALWVSGPDANTQLSADALPATHIGEIPQEAQAIIPDEAVGDTQEHAAAIPEEYASYVADLADRYDLSPALIEALVWQESRWRADAVSPAGARGFAQLMPGTAQDLGVDPDNPLANLEGGARYLREQLDRFDGDLELALAAYNAGPSRVARLGRVPRIRETQVYVAAIMGRLSDYSRSSD